MRVLVRNRIDLNSARLSVGRNLLLFASGLLACGLMATFASSVPAADETELAGQPTWAAPTTAQVRAEVFRWLDECKVDPAKRAEIAKTIWADVPEAKPAEAKQLETAKPEPVKPLDGKSPESKTERVKPGDAKLTDAKPADAPKTESIAKASAAAVNPGDQVAAEPKADAKPAELKPSELLEHVVRTVAAIDPAAQKLVDTTSKPRVIGQLVTFPWLADEKTPRLVRANLRLWYGEWLVHEQLYDESLDQLTGLEPTDVVDPAALLFYQGVDYHWLLKKEPGLKTIARLLERRDHLPRRYAQMADLMQSDLSALKDDSLDHIDRRMRDTERHLDLGRAGKKVRGIEDGIITSLDKMIDQLEKQQSQSSGAGAGMGPGGTRSSSPAPDSAPLQGKGPGNVTAKDIGHKSGWGDLPPKQREEALQAIGKEFPSHFRDAIEAYFKRLATDDTNEP